MNPFIFWQVSHEFPMNFNPSNPYCNGKLKNKHEDFTESLISVCYLFSCGSELLKFPSSFSFHDIFNFLLYKVEELHQVGG